MAHDDSYHRLLQRFAAAIGIKQLAFDAAGHCNLYVNDTIPLTIKRSDDGQTLTVLCSLEQGLPSEIERYWAQRVLEIALNPARNAPGIGFAPASNSLILYRILPLSALEVDKLQSVIAELLAIREQWPQQLAAPSLPPQRAWITRA
ncbi:CesT family type III secretion system chaperone [Aeromonas jandaei]|uniref:CesT family type III secretion system chaperone n=1 Tax=Aeromonas jandaei TaxID=650 RepID=UPI0011174452|nr:CesT family type III secretion system chaperone [Aeromonas jandaei]TNH99674.1 hypothetical protein CF104_15085 [Aeromonas jandaei]